jgi:hypothetical protein
MASILVTIPQAPHDPVAGIVTEKWKDKKRQLHMCQIHGPAKDVAAI